MSGMEKKLKKGKRTGEGSPSSQRKESGDDKCEERSYEATRRSPRTSPLRSDRTRAPTTIEQSFQFDFLGIRASTRDETPQQPSRRPQNPPPRAIQFDFLGFRTSTHQKVPEMPRRSDRARRGRAPSGRADERPQMEEYLRLNRRRQISSLEQRRAGRTPRRCLDEIPMKRSVPRRSSRTSPPVPIAGASSDLGQDHSSDEETYLDYLKSVHSHQTPQQSRRQREGVRTPAMRRSLELNYPKFRTSTGDEMPERRSVPERFSRTSQHTPRAEAKSPISKRTIDYSRFSSSEEEVTEMRSTLGRSPRTSSPHSLRPGARRGSGLGRGSISSSDEEAYMEYLKSVHSPQTPQQSRRQPEVGRTSPSALESSYSGIKTSIGNVISQLRSFLGSPPRTSPQTSPPPEEEQPTSGRSTEPGHPGFLSSTEDEVTDIRSVLGRSPRTSSPLSLRPRARRGSGLGRETCADYMTSDHSRQTSPQSRRQREVGRTTASGRLFELDDPGEASSTSQEGIPPGPSTQRSTRGRLKAMATSDDELYQKFTELTTSIHPYKPQCIQPERSQFSRQVMENTRFLDSMDEETFEEYPPRMSPLHLLSEEEDDEMSSISRPNLSVSEEMLARSVLRFTDEEFDDFLRLNFIPLTPTPSSFKLAGGRATTKRASGDESAQFSAPRSDLVLDDAESHLNPLRSKGERASASAQSIGDGSSYARSSVMDDVPAERSTSGRSPPGSPPISHRLRATMTSLSELYVSAKSKQSASETLEDRVIASRSPTRSHQSDSPPLYRQESSESGLSIIEENPEEGSIPLGHHPLPTSPTQSAQPKFTDTPSPGRSVYRYESKMSTEDEAHVKRMISALKEEQYKCSPIHEKTVRERAGHLLPPSPQRLLIKAVEGSSGISTQKEETAPSIHEESAREHRGRLPLSSPLHPAPIEATEDSSFRKTGKSESLVHEKTVEERIGRLLLPPPPQRLLIESGEGSSGISTQKEECTPSIHEESAREPTGRLSLPPPPQRLPATEDSSFRKAEKSTLSTDVDITERIGHRSLPLPLLRLPIGSGEGSSRSSFTGGRSVDPIVKKIVEERPAFPGSHPPQSQRTDAWEKSSFSIYEDARPMFSSSEESIVGPSPLRTPLAQRMDFEDDSSSISSYQDAQSRFAIDEETPGQPLVPARSYETCCSQQAEDSSSSILSYRGEPSYATVDEFTSDDGMSRRSLPQPLEQGVSTFSHAPKSRPATVRPFKSRTVHFDYAEEFEFQSDIALLLDMMEKSQITDRIVFIRELIANGRDALEKLQYLWKESKIGVTLRSLELKIEINTDEENGIITIDDNGIGMSEDELISNLGTIARSSSRVFIEQLMNEDQQTRKPAIIGQFGLGFYSAFLVASKVVVTSKPLHGRAHQWTSFGTGTFTLTTAQKQSNGTTVTLYLKPEHTIYAHKYRLKQLIQKYGEFYRHQIYLNGEKVITIEPLWTLNPDVVTLSAHNTLYRILSNSDDNPRFILHYRSSDSSPVRFNCLIFFPKEKLGKRLVEYNVHLYAKAVLIQPDATVLIPSWLRFIQGIVDTEDLPLNSNFFLDSEVVHEIRGALVKKIVQFLREVASKNEHEYQRFYLEFSPYFQEGAMFSSSESDRLEAAKLLLFESSKTPLKERITLPDYCKRMVQGQKRIFYLFARSREVAQQSPYLEAVKEDGIEIILIRHVLDRKVLQSLKKFDCYDIVPIQEEIRDYVVEELGPDCLDKSELDRLCKWIVISLKGKVTNVQISKKLDAHPCIISVRDLEDARRRISSNPQWLNDENMCSALEPLLEINPRHPLIEKLSTLTTSNVEFANVVIEQMMKNALVNAGLLEDAESAVEGIYKVLELCLPNYQSQ